MNTLYRVIFSGQALPSVTPAQLQANLAQRFQLPPDKARAMLGRGDVVIKKHLPKDKAMRYLAALQQIGAVARMEVEKVPQAAAPPPTPSGAPPASAPTDRRNQEAAAEHNPYAAPRAHVADVETTEYGELRVLTVQGRIGRLRYLVRLSALALIPAVILIPSIPLLVTNHFAGIFLVLLVVPLLLYPVICIQAQRLHDIGISAWFMLIGIIPVVGGLFNFAVLCWPGSKDENDYGLPPPPNSAAVKLIGGILLAVGCVVTVVTIVSYFRAIQAHQMQL